MGRTDKDFEFERGPVRVVSNVTSKVKWSIHRSCMEFIDGKSQTVPDEAMSIRQIMTKFVRGMQVPEELYRESAYDSGASFDSQDLEAIGRMDLAERDEYIVQLKADIDLRKKDLAAVKAAFDKRKLVKEVDDQEDVKPKPGKDKAAKGGTTDKAADVKAVGDSDEGSS